MYSNSGFEAKKRAMWSLGDRLSAQKHAADGNEGGVFHVSRALIVGDPNALCVAQVSQHQVDRGEAADPVAILNGRHLVIKTSVVAPADGRHQRLVA